MTRGVIFWESTTTIPPGWYGILFGSSVVLQVRLEWNLTYLVLDLQLSLVSTFGQHNPISCHRCISTTLKNRWRCSSFYFYSMLGHIIDIEWMNPYRVWCLCSRMIIQIRLITSQNGCPYSLKFSCIIKFPLSVSCCLLLYYLRKLIRYQVILL